MLYCFLSITAEFVSSINQADERNYEGETQSPNQESWEVEGI